MVVEKGAYFEVDTVRLPQKELRMTLYMQQVWRGPKANQKVVVDPGSDFGKIAANEWPVLDGMGSGANIIGNVQGMHIGCSKTASPMSWNIYFDLLFNEGRFKGSTLKLLGSYIGAQGGEWAIVGGTGEFTLAQGIVAFKKVQGGDDMNTRELKFRVFYTPLKA